MATTIKTVNTLDITFHVDDGSVTGDSFVWKFNVPNPNIPSLSYVKQAFGYDANGQIIADGSVVAFLSMQETGYWELQDKNGNIIDGIDGATVTTVVTTKQDLS